MSLHSRSNRAIRACAALAMATANVHGVQLRKMGSNAAGVAVPTADMAAASRGDLGLNAARMLAQKEESTEDSAYHSAINKVMKFVKLKHENVRNGQRQKKNCPTPEDGAYYSINFDLSTTSGKRQTVILYFKGTAEGHKHLPEGATSWLDVPRFIGLKMAYGFEEGDDSGRQILVRQHRSSRSDVDELLRVVCWDMHLVQVADRDTRSELRHSVLAMLQHFKLAGGDAEFRCDHIATAPLAQVESSFFDGTGDGQWIPDKDSRAWAGRATLAGTSCEELLGAQ